MADGADDSGRRRHRDVILMESGYSLFPEEGAYHG